MKMSETVANSFRTRSMICKKMTKNGVNKNSRAGMPVIHEQPGITYSETVPQIEKL